MFVNRQDAKGPEPDERRDQLARRVIGACIAVHRTLGPGFLESIYEEAVCIELIDNGIAFERQVPIAVEYRGRVVGEGRVDLLVERTLVVELKAVRQLTEIHLAQVMSYLKALGEPLGLLVNFHVPLLRAGIRRVILSSGPLAPWRLGG